MKVDIDPRKDTFTVTNLDMKPTVAALRQIADQLESGRLVYEEGGMSIRTNQLPHEEGGFHQVTINSDLVLTELNINKVTTRNKWTTMVKSGEVLVYKMWSDGSGEQCPLARLRIEARSVEGVRADAQCMADALNRRDGGVWCEEEST